MFQGKMPLRMGITSAPGHVPKAQLQPHLLRFSQATQLRDLAETYAFYTPALIYMRVRLMGRDIHTQFLEEYGKQVLPISIRFNKPLFQGLDLGGDRSWNYVLYGIEREHWDAYRQFMGTMCFVDRPLKLISRVRTRELTIPDPLFLEKVSVVPTRVPIVPLTAFCLDTNQGCAWIEPGNHFLLDLPQLRTAAKVFEDTAVFARTILTDGGNPYEAVDKLQAQRQQACAPLAEPTPVPLESLAGPHQDALRDLVHQYRQFKGKP